MDEDLRASMEMYRILMTTSPDAVTVTDLYGNITQVSKQTLRQHGFTKEEELLGVSAFTLIDEADHTYAEANLRKVIEDGSIRDVEYTMLRADGTTFVGELNASLIRDAEGEPKAFISTTRDITGRRQAEDALRESEEKFRSLAEQSPNMIFINKDERVVYANQQCESLMGYKREEFYAPEFNFMDLIAEDSREVTQNSYQAHLKGEEVPPYEYGLITKDGKRVEALITTKLIQYEDGNAIMGIITDIDELKRMEDALRENESRYRTLFEESAISLWEEDWSEVRTYYDEVLASGESDLRAFFEQHPEAVTECMERIKILDINSATLELHEAKNKEELLAGLDQVLPEEAMDIFREELVAVAEGERNFECETVHRTLRGQKRNVYLRLHIPQGYEETLSRVFVSMMDITENKRSTDEVRRLTDFTESILQSMSEGVVVDDREGRFRYVNQAAAAMLGFSTEDLVGEHWKTFIPADQQEIVDEANARRRDGKADRYELDLIRKDGSQFPVLVSGSPRFVGDELRGTMAVFMDITSRKQREREQDAIVIVSTALRLASNRGEMQPIILEQLIHLLEAEGAAIAMRDPETSESVCELGHGVWSNWTGERLPPGEGVSGHVIETGETYTQKAVSKDPMFARPDLLGELDALICAPLIAHEETIGALLVGRKREFVNGEIRILTAIADMAANALYRTNLMETLEERVLERTQELEEANEQLLELDRLKSDFVSNVSHELRTPITNIMLYLNLMERQSSEEESQRYMDILQNESFRLANLIEDLLTLSRLDEGSAQLPLEPHVLDALLDEVVTSQQARAEERSITIHYETNPGIPPFEVGRDQIVQVFTNLLSNALAYSSIGSEVILSSEMIDFEDQSYAVVRIHNDGPPIPEEDLPHIFDRFFRGKIGRESGQAGTGLGLAICKEIVEQHNGRIEVESSESEGTTFTVWLLRNSE
jgi:PAS domain S-box-containing protein